MNEAFIHISHFIDLEALWFRGIFLNGEYAWSALSPKYKEKWIESNLVANVRDIERTNYLVSTNSIVETRRNGRATIEAGAYIKGDHIELMDGAHVEAGAWISGPTIIGPHTTVRHGAYVRGGVITGENCIIGHASEIKSSILGNGAKAAHFAYVGDSLLGNEVNLGAGTKISNLKIIEGTIYIQDEGKKIDTGLRKFGAIMGDRCQTGCNAVLNPGSLLEPECLVYPCASVKPGLHKTKNRIKS